MISCSQNQQMPQGLIFCHTKGLSTSSNSRKNEAITACFSCVQSTTWSPWWQTDHITKSTTQYRHLTAIPAGMGHRRQQKTKCPSHTGKKGRHLYSHTSKTPYTVDKFFIQITKLNSINIKFFRNILNFESLSQFCSTNIRKITGKG